MGGRRQAQTARFASRGRSDHVPVALHSACNIRASKRRCCFQRAWATRSAVGKQKSRLVRAARCRVLRAVLLRRPASDAKREVLDDTLNFPAAGAKRKRASVSSRY